MTKVEASGFSAEEIAESELLFARDWSFVKGVPSLEWLPEADRPEIAFAGRSNVGKSSLINALVNQSDLARTSNTPGRTQDLNYFTPPGRAFYLVDMPGYGFAKAPKEKVDAWTELVTDYLKGRPNLARVFLLIDSRHGLKAVDAEIMKMLDKAAVSYQVVLTKSDKIKPSELLSVCEATEKKLKEHAAAFPVVIATSSETKDGLEELRATAAALVKAHFVRLF
jgi:GTP-binding protein